MTASAPTRPESSVTVSVALAFGATVSNIPVLSEGANALNFAEASIVSEVWSVSPKLATV